MRCRSDGLPRLIGISVCLLGLATAYPVGLDMMMPSFNRSEWCFLSRLRIYSVAEGFLSPTLTVGATLNTSSLITILDERHGQDAIWYLDNVLLKIIIFVNPEQADYLAITRNAPEETTFSVFAPPVDNTTCNICWNRKLFRAKRSS